MSSNSEIVTIGDLDFSARLCNGQIASLKHRGFEFIHDASLPEHFRSRGCLERISNGAPKYSGLEMFPFVGLPDEVWGKGKIENYGRHGISRHLKYELLGKEDPMDDYVRFFQWHNGVDKIGELDAIYKYGLTKCFNVNNGALDVGYWIRNDSGESFCYDFGTHPIFIAPKNYENGVFLFNGGEFTLKDVLNEKGNVKFLDYVREVRFFNMENDSGLRFTFDFGNTMIWTPSVESGVFGFEPKTLVDIRKKKMGGDGVMLEPGMYAKYGLRIEPFFY